MGKFLIVRFGRNGEYHFKLKLNSRMRNKDLYALVLRLSKDYENAIAETLESDRLFECRNGAFYRL